MIEPEQLANDFPIENYPDLIKEWQKHIWKAEQDLMPYEAELQQMDLIIERQISDQKATLINDTLRKTFKREKQQTLEYQEVLQYLNQKRTEIALFKIDLECILNKFAVSKIKERQKTAELQLQAAELHVA